MYIYIYGLIEVKMTTLTVYSLLTNVSNEITLPSNI